MQTRRCLPWFEPHMDPKWADIVANKGHRCLYKKGEEIVGEGDILHHAYYVSEGLVQYAIHNYHGHTRVVCIVAPGRFFGLGPAFDRLPLENSVITMEDSVIYMLSKNDITNAINQDAELASDVIVNLNSKLRGAYNLIGVLSLMKPEERLVHCLSSIIQSFNIAEGDGWYSLPFNLSHEQLGEMIGAHRVTVCRILNMWRKRKLLATKKEIMQIHNNLFTKNPDIANITKMKTC